MSTSIKVSIQVDKAANGGCSSRCGLLAHTHCTFLALESFDSVHPCKCKNEKKIQWSSVERQKIWFASHQRPPLEGPAPRHPQLDFLKPLHPDRRWCSPGPYNGRPSRKCDLCRTSQICNTIKNVLLATRNLHRKENEPSTAPKK